MKSDRSLTDMVCEKTSIIFKLTKTSCMELKRIGLVSLLPTSLSENLYDCEVSVNVLKVKIDDIVTCCFASQLEIKGNGNVGIFSPMLADNAH